MRLLICFYIVLGLFKLFQGLAHGIHSNSAYGILVWERETKSNELPGGSWEVVQLAKPGIAEVGTFCFS